MPARNTSPFLMETWSVEGWRDGWDCVETFSIGTRAYLMLLRSQGHGSDGHNVHIHVLDEDGRVGERVTAYAWAEGWSRAAVWSAGGRTFVLLVMTQGHDAQGHNVHVRELNADGSVGVVLAHYRWTSGWTTVLTCLVANKPCLMLLKQAGYGDDDRNVHLHRLEVGSVGDRLSQYRLDEGWQTATTWRAGGQTCVFLLRSTPGTDGCHAHVFRLEDDGRLGVRLAQYRWSSGWTVARAIRAADRDYLFLLKRDTGVVHVNAITPAGHIGQLVFALDREPSYHGGSAFGTGSMASQNGPVPWTSGWSDVAVVVMEGQCSLFVLKTTLSGDQKKRAKMIRLAPMVPVGPMVLGVTDHAATVWVGTAGPAVSAQVEYGQAGGRTRRVPVVFGGDLQAYYRAGTARLASLASGARYDYTVTFDGQPFGSGSFRTAPGPGRGRFTVAVVSCIDLSDPRQQPAWTHLRAQSPDLLLLIGDNAYANTTMRSMIWAEHLQQRGVEGFANVIRDIPVFATWDDHDFGPNNASGADVERTHRQESRDTFVELFAGLPLVDDEGIQGAFVWGDVAFFMLDVRYFRHHYHAGVPAVRDLLGESQWQWLEDALLASEARFKVIVSGTTLDSHETETWADDYPREWGRLRRLVERVHGVVVASGDIHCCRIMSHPLDSGRLLWEIISSAMTGQSGNDHAFVTLTFDTRVAGVETVCARRFRQDGSDFPPVTISLADI